MTILVCPLSKVPSLIATRAPERIVSLLDPGSVFPESGADYVGRHLRLQFHDVCVPGEGWVVPAATHIEELLAFLMTWRRAAPLLVHCRAGISRSTAAAFIAACLHNPGVEERTIALALRGVAPLARPNESIIELADAAMHRHGRMSAAIAATGRDLPWIEVAEGLPFAMPSTEFGR